MTVPFWLKFALWVALAGGIAWAGWTIDGWRRDSIIAAQVTKQLAAERAAHASSETARVAMAGNLSSASTKVHETIKEVIRRVPTLVHDDRACDFDGELTGVLNRARGYDMPGARRPATATATGAAPAP